MTIFPEQGHWRTSSHRPPLLHFLEVEKTGMATGIHIVSCGAFCDDISYISVPTDTGAGGAGAEGSGRGSGNDGGGCRSIKTAQVPGVCMCVGRKTQHGNARPMIAL